MTSSAPAAASSNAIARPMPRELPVTTARWPARGSWSVRAWGGWIVIREKEYQSLVWAQQTVSRDLNLNLNLNLNPPLESKHS